MVEGFKVFFVMCVWAFACNLMTAALPGRPSAYVLVPFFAFCLLGFVWLVPVTVMGVRTANYMVKLTLGIWAGTGLIAGLMILGLS